MNDTTRFLFDQNQKHDHQVTIISGSDEVGRGAMAGPIVVASVILKPNYCNPAIKDSKLLSALKRDVIFQQIISNCISYAIKVYDAVIVDELNPKQTSIKGMIETIKQLSIKPDLCLIDGEDVKIPNYKTLKIIKGDFKSQSIAAASILAKVHRDRIMEEYDIKYKGYNFAKHKGYCTLEHIKKVKKLGILSIHRQSYKPIIKLKEK